MTDKTQITQINWNDLSREEADRQMDNIHRIQQRVAIRAGGLTGITSQGWVARQRQSITDPNNPETKSHQWVGWSFIVNNRDVFIPHEDAMHDPDDTEFIDKLAERVLGYPVGSPQHYQMQLDKCYDLQLVQGQQLKMLSNQITYNNNCIRSLLQAQRAAEHLAVAPAAEDAS